MMTESIESLLKILKKRDYRKLRKETKMDVTALVSGCDPFKTDAILLKTMLEHETPIIFEHDRMGFNRTERLLPFFCDSNGNKASSDNKRGNIVPNYEHALKHGFDYILADVRSRLEADERKIFYKGIIIALEASLSFADRYREYALQNGHLKLYNALCNVPHKSPSSFYEACVFLKFIIFTLRCNRNSHITLGRFDQYMYPYFLSDLEADIPMDMLFETLEEFFVSLNFDTDLYCGMQQGDNGQSLVLGGYSMTGEDMYNPLSELCMKASLELSLIDPKINLRVSNKTPIPRLEFATMLTRQGLGFLQYCNDDVVVPGLIALGYAEEDAYNYAVAACWEYIVSNNAMDIPNLLVMNFPQVLEAAVFSELQNCRTFDAFLGKVKDEIIKECDRLINKASEFAHYKDIRNDVSPYLSVFIGGCIENGKDAAEAGAVYNNYGVHGAGISTATDSLAAIKKAVFEDKICTAEELLTALQANFEGYTELRNKLLSYPKMGNNDDYADILAAEIMQTFADNLNGRTNHPGGVFRPGTGSAMEYILSAARVGATPDGRKSGQPYGSSFSLSITTKLDGPLSCIQSFTKFDMTKIINGGPLTMEIHDTVSGMKTALKRLPGLLKALLTVADINYS